MGDVGRLERTLCFFLLSTASLLSKAQVTATLTAVESTVQVGKPFLVELSVRHPENVVVIFPDSAAEFAPYELFKSEPRPTHTEGGNSVDAALLSLMTWEIDSVQAIQLPVQFLRGPGDTATVLSNRVEVLFQPMIPVYSDTLKLKMHGGLAEIKEPFPWLGFLVLFAFLVLMGTTLYLLLRKPMGKMFRRIKVKQEWERFLKGHKSALTTISQQELFTERLQANWKEYFDRKGAFKLKAMTSPELEFALENAVSLNEDDIQYLIALGRFRDMLVFGGVAIDEEKLRELHGKVESIMAKEYQRRKEAAEA